MYQSRSGGVRQVLGTGVAVGAIQIGIAVAVLSTFVGGIIQNHVHPKYVPPHWTYMPPPKLTPSVVERRAVPGHATAKAPDPTIEGLAPTTGPILGPLSSLPPLGGDDRSMLSDIPPQPIKPSFPPIAARPLGDPGAWITPDDYPSRALREGWSGVTRLHLVIGSDGKVSACSVIASSGHPALDAVACNKVSQRAQFSPARDGAGALHEGTFDSSIRWQIHEE